MEGNSPFSKNFVMLALTVNEIVLFHYGYNYFYKLLFLLFFHLSSNYRDFISKNITHLKFNLTIEWKVISF